MLKMSEFMSLDRSGDWDLHAIVKGNTNIIKDLPPPYTCAWLESLELEDYHGQENVALLNELEQLCKPLNHGIPSDHIPPKIFSTSVITSFDKHAKCPTIEPKKKITDDVSCASTSAAAPTRRRRNKHKMTLVQQAAGDRILSDKWNWRKYGEKVIKGSPYPRSYYRCSNTGGCVARKQVERSRTDPGIFLITYIDQHSHPYPTRRPSQAGRTAKRFHTDVARVHTNSESEHMSTGSTTTGSPIIEVEAQFKLGNEEHGTVERVGEHVYVPNNSLEDDFFVGLEYLEGLQMDFFVL